MAVYQSPGVYVREVPSGSKPIEGVGTAIAAFIGLTEKGPSGEATLVANWGDFTRTFGGFVAGYVTPLSVYSYFDNGGGRCYVVRVNADEGAAAAVAQLPASSNAALGSLRVKALEAGGQVSVDVAPASEPGDDLFKLVVHGPGGATEEFDNVSLKRGKGGVVTEVKSRSKLITIEEIATEGGPVERKPATGTYQLAVVASTSAPAEPGRFTGDVAQRTGVAGLEAIDEVTMLIAPDVMPLQAAGALSMDQAVAIQLALISHAERMGSRVAIIDPPPGLGAQAMLEWRQSTLKADTSYAALYYPWIKVMDPLSRQPIYVPPSGAMAG